MLAFSFQYRLWRNVTLATIVSVTFCSFQQMWHLRFNNADWCGTGDWRSLWDVLRIIFESDRSEYNIDLTEGVQYTAIFVAVVNLFVIGAMIVLRNCRTRDYSCKIAE
jgi:hypothetical protein